VSARYRSRGALAPALLLAAAAALPAPAAARLLLEDRGTEVHLDRPLVCGQPAAVRIAADRPDLFDAGNPRLQGLLDATRAMLGYECRDLREIRVTGGLRGETRERYAGMAGDATGWRLQPDRGYVASAPSAAAPPAPAAPAGSAFTVRGLATGMTPDAAMREARTGFDAAPRYDAARRELAVERDGCALEPGSRPRAGQVCLKAHFTEGRDPRSYRLRYAQVVDRDQAEPIAAQLRERFGAPAVDEERRGSAWLQGGAPERHLGWGAQTAADDGRPRRELEADIRVEGGVTVLTLDLLDAGGGAASSGAATGDRPRYEVKF